ncbi:uncharacterized protein LOC134819652 [Bolinopsis microptera]|uniref:uncharacterized protein LOC134819652 n=1 Tax=Bolinopsis microptera TaxID=2820187 RepID=UPI003079DEED
MEDILRINQNGFRESRSTTSHILGQRRVFEGAQDKDLTAVILFIDFKKAFDSVHRGLLMKILLAYGIPKKIVGLIQRMYADTFAQGRDFGFNLHPRRSRRSPAVKVTDADFADDLALITDSVAEAQDFLRSLELAAKSVELHLNEGKTKYMGINIRDDDSPTLVAGSGKTIEKVDDFVYLGSRMKSSEKDFEVRKAKAWGACHHSPDEACMEVG